MFDWIEFLVGEAAGGEYFIWGGISCESARDNLGELTTLDAEDPGFDNFFTSSFNVYNQIASYFV